MTRLRLGVVALTAYAAAIYSANLLTHHLGQVPVAPGMVVTAGTYAAGLALLLRDAVQELCGWRWVLAGVLAGGLLTAATAPELALASAVAFLVAECADWAAYSWLRPHGWETAAFLSGCVGALADTLLFLWISPFPVTAAGVGGQMIGKVAWATALPILAVIAYRQVRRAVPRHTLGT